MDYEQYLDSEQCQLECSKVNIYYRRNIVDTYRKYYEEIKRGLLALKKEMKKNTKRNK